MANFKKRKMLWFLSNAVILWVNYHNHEGSSELLLDHIWNISNDIYSFLISKRKSSYRVIALKNVSVLTNFNWTWQSILKKQCKGKCVSGISWQVWQNLLGQVGKYVLGQTILTQKISKASNTTWTLCHFIWVIWLIKGCFLELTKVHHS